MLVHHLGIGGLILESRERQSHGSCQACVGVGFV